MRINKLANTKDEDSSIIIPETDEDLWHISKVINKGDKVEARTIRTHKVEGSKEEKKKVRLLIEVEESLFNEYTGKLRIRGRIINGSPEEFVQIGKYHSFEIGTGEQIKIIKKWKRFEIDVLRKAVEKSHANSLLIIAMDEKDASVSYLTPVGINFEKSSLKTSIDKQDNDKSYSSYFKSIYEIIENFVNANPNSKVLVAGPGFAKDNFKQWIEEKGKKEIVKKIMFESCSNSTKSGVIELLKTGKIGKALENSKIQEEFEIIESFKKHVGKDDGLAIYGLDEFKKAAEIGAVESCLMLLEKIKKNKELQKIYSQLENTKTKVILVDKTSENVKLIESFGGVLGILRYRIN